MKKYNYLMAALVACNLFATSCANVDNDGVNSETNLPNAVYIDGADKQIMNKVSVKENGGEAEFTPRTSNLATENVTVAITSDKEALNRFNKENGARYTLLPKEYYELSAEEVTIEKGNVSGNPIKVTIKATAATELDATKKYALPLSIVSKSNLQALKSSSTKIFALDRILKTSALVHRGFNLKMSFPEDKPLFMEEWTLQYAICADNPTASGNQAVISTATEDLGFYSRMVNSGNIQFKTAGSDEDNTYLYAKGSVPAKKWIIITWVYKDQHITAYVNGVQTNYFIAKAVKFPWIATGWGASYRGLMRDVRLYNKAMTAFQISEALYVEDPANENLVFYAPLDKVNQLKNVATSKASKDSGASDFSISVNPNATLSYEDSTFPAE